MQIFSHPFKTTLMFVLAGCLASLFPVSASLATIATGAGQAIIAPVPRSGIYYEIFVRSWYDTDGDGVGDLNGVTKKLNYLASLGVNAIWLMPINPSPSSHGYDVTDYRAINPQYGTMQNFEHLVSEAHKRGIKIVMDLVVNHTSSQNPWFEKAQDPSSPYRNWYIWAKEGQNLYETSALGINLWHKGLHGYYLGVFTSEMPDLNYDNPKVRDEIIKVAKFWTSRGVDGFRLDAARHIYDDRIGDEDNPTLTQKNVLWWQQFAKGIDRDGQHTYLVGEVSGDRYQELAPYLRALDAVFDFPFAERLVQAAKTGNRGDLSTWLPRQISAYRAAAGGSFKDAIFLSNHDQTRVMTQLDNDVDRMKVAAAMLFTLPGDIYLYYGEELGTKGRNRGFNRQPMRWHESSHASGEATWQAPSESLGPQESVQAEKQRAGSLLRFYQELAHWREQIPALRNGRLHVVPQSDKHLWVYTLADAHGDVMVVHNLSGMSHRFVIPPDYSEKKIRLTTDTSATLAHRTLTLPSFSVVVLD